MNFSLFVNILCLSIISIGILLSLIFLLFIFIRIRPLKSNIPIILTCNTYIALLASSAIVFKTTFQTIEGFLHSYVVYQGFNCQVNGYFIYVALGNVFYSYILHAIFRLLRIVFYRQKSLYSGRVFSILIFLQWILILLINLPFLLFKQMEYIPSEYRCQVAYTNSRGTLMILFIECLIPGTIMFTIYFYIIRYIRQTNNRMIHRHDTMIFKKTFSIFIIIQLLFIPLLILWLLHLFINFSPSLGYQLQGVVVTFSQMFIPIVLAYSTPQIREKFKGRRQTRVYPIVYQNRANLQQKF